MKARFITALMLIALSSGTSSAVEITSEIADTVAIKCIENDVWLVTQQKLAELGAVGNRPRDYAQVPTWVRIENAGEAKTITLAVKWIDTGYGTFRKSGYLKHDDAWTVMTGEMGTDRTTYRLELPKGTSWFGPVPWYGVEDATRWMERIASSHAEVRVRALGKTKEGREIRCLTIGDEKRPNVLVVGREHGGESASSFAVEAVVEHLLSKEFPRELREAFCFHVVPMANPDGVANGWKFPQPGPVEQFDLHYSGMTAPDPSCVVMREETLRLRPVAYVNYHSYLFPMPQVIFYQKEAGICILDALIGDKPGEADSWYLKRLPPGGDSTLYHCHRAFGALVVLFELPWTGRKVESLRAQGVATFRAAMEALVKKNKEAAKP